MSSPLPVAQPTAIHLGAHSTARSPLSEALQWEWSELAARCRAAPYLHPGWFEAWWRAFGAGDLDIRTLRRGGRLVGLLPMAWVRGVLGSTANYHTPAFGILAEDSEAALALTRELFTASPTHLSITSLDPAAETIDVCQRAAREAGYKLVIRAYQRSLYIDLNGTWAGYESGLGRNLVRNLRRARRHLGLEGVLAAEMTDGRQGLEGSLREAFAVESSGWKGLGGTAIESHPKTQGFYTDIARWAAEHGMLRLYFLKLDHHPLAMYFALVHQGVCHLLKGGYDPAYRRYSPGNLLMHIVIRDCFAAGLTRIELNGDAEPYKFWWAAAVRERKRFEAFAPDTAGHLAWAGFTYVRPVTRRLQRTLGLRPDGEA